MTVYVDDAGIPASVRNGSRVHTSTWCHLTADTQEELHAFAARLGLKRSYFQPGKPLGGKPSPFWHYDVTAGKRAQAVALGALEVPTRELPGICRTRSERQPAAGVAPGREPTVGHGPGCGYPGCGEAQARPYMAGLRCDSHKPRGQFVPARELPPASEPVLCPGCGTARLMHGEPRCQGCGTAQNYRPAGATYADLSHGQPGHMCVLPGGDADSAAGLEAEAV